MAIVLSPMVTQWAGYYLSIRAIQKVALGMIIPPLMWSGLSFHSIMLGLPVHIRKAVTKAIVRRSTISEFLRKFKRIQICDNKRYY